jgi:hypothetical protein
MVVGFLLRGGCLRRSSDAEDDENASRPRDVQGAKLYGLLEKKEVNDRTDISVYIYNRISSINYWLFCPHHTVDKNMGFENYFITALDVCSDIRDFPFHIFKNVLVKYKPTIYSEDRMYVSTMCYRIVDVNFCEHALLETIARDSISFAANHALREIVEKTKTMNYYELAKNVNDTVKEIGVKYSILIAPKLVYDLFVCHKRLMDNLEYIRTNCTCLRILSRYCHCEAIKYFL